MRISIDTSATKPQKVVYGMLTDSERGKIKALAVNYAMSIPTGSKPIPPETKNGNSRIEETPTAMQTRLKPGIFASHLARNAMPNI